MVVLAERDSVPGGGQCPAKLRGDWSWQQSARDLGATQSPYTQLDHSISQPGTRQKHGAKVNCKYYKD